MDSEYVRRMLETELPGLEEKEKIKETIPGCAEGGYADGWCHSRRRRRQSEVDRGNPPWIFTPEGKNQRKKWRQIASEVLWIFLDDVKVLPRQLRFLLTSQEMHLGKAS